MFSMLSNKPNRKKIYRGRDFRECSNFKDYDFVGADLRGANFEGCQNLEGKDFSRAKIGGTNFKECNLKNAFFDDAQANFPVFWAIFFRVAVIIVSIVASLIIFYSFHLINILADGDNVGISVSQSASQVALGIREGCDRNQSNLWSEETCKIASEVNSLIPEITNQLKEISKEVRIVCTGEAESEFISEDSCAAADAVLDLEDIKPYSISYRDMYLICLGSLAVISMLSINFEFFGFLIIAFSISMLFIALEDYSTAVPVSYSLIAFLGVIVGFLLKIQSVAIMRAADFCKSKSYRTPLFLNSILWFFSVIAIIIYFSYNLERDQDFVMPFLLSIIVLAFGDFIGRKVISNNDVISDDGSVRLESRKHILIEYFTVRFLQWGATTNFFKAELKGASFDGTYLKEYATSIGGKEYDDETLEAILRRGDSSRKFYERMSQFSGAWGKGLLYSGLIMNVVNERVREIRVLGDIDNNGTMNFGDIIGDIESTVVQLSGGPIQREDLKVKEELVKLLSAIESSPKMSNKEKFKSINGVKKLVESLQDGK